MMIPDKPLRSRLEAVTQLPDMATKGRRVQVTLTADLERRLTLWAYTRDERLPNWMKTVLRLGVDENWSKIPRALKERADRLGMPVDALERKVLEQAGFDFDRELQELEANEADDDD